MRSGQRGFTLIELMVVVTITGVLTLLAVFGMRTYVLDTKTAEAQNSVGQIAKAAASAYERDSMSGNLMAAGGTSAVSASMCPAATQSVPSSSSMIQGQKYQSAPSDWNHDEAANAGFACLKFTMDQPQYYMYSYTVTGTGSAVGDQFTATAQGDLDGDGVLSLFQVVGEIQPGQRVAITPNILVVRPDE